MSYLCIEFPPNRSQLHHPTFVYNFFYRIMISILYGWLIPKILVFNFDFAIHKKTVKFVSSWILDVWPKQI